MQQLPYARPELLEAYPGRGITEEQKAGFFTRHYDTLQKQWKEHCDKFLAANGTKLNENEINHQLKDSLENLVSVNKVISIHMKICRKKN